MSRWIELDPLAPDISQGLRGLSQVLTGSIVLRMESGGVFLFTAVEPLMDGSVDATWTVADGDAQPEPASVLVFPDEECDAQALGDQLDNVPDPPLHARSPVWLCERAEDPAQALLEIRVTADDTRHFQVYQVRPRPGRRVPSPAAEKRPEPPGNLKRRSDWFQGGTRRR